MSDLNTSQFTVDQAVKLLKRYSCLPTQSVESEVQKEQLREALLLVTRESEWENLGICAENTASALAALRSYLEALGYQVNFNLVDIPNLNESVYLKFNTQKMSYYLERYPGEYRGVLVSCQGEQENIIGTYGYFPLNLFE
jgi:hypothetical protein